MANKPWTKWFEIPVLDFDRAQTFYENIFQIEFTEVHDLGALKMGVFPHDNVGAAICQAEWYQPSLDGTLVYLNAEPDLTNVLERVEPFGGKVLLPKKQISPDHGFMAVFVDTEGNRLALHSTN